MNKYKVFFVVYLSQLVTSHLSRGFMLGREKVMDLFDHL